MKTHYIIITLSALILFGASACSASVKTTNSAPTNKNVPVVNTTPAQPQINVNEASVTPAKNTLTDPIANFVSRVTKKPFGIYITPKTSPIQPERFKGYHTGADAETTTAEQKIDVPVYAINNGTVVYRNWVSGYGGVVMLRVVINGQIYTALYGHLRIASVTVRVGQSVKAGTKLAVLGTGFSHETDGERRHLHFSLHKGSSIVLLGYVQSKAALAGWINPLTLSWK